MSGFTHFDEKGNAVMVDVHEKADTYRVAVAQGTITVNEEVFQAITNHTAKKGDVLGIARIAGIMGAKKNAELIPLCHIIALTDCEIEFVLDEKTRQITATCRTSCVGKTGVEMEAMTGVSVALLTIYDMCKAMDRGMVISEIHLVEKMGGTIQVESKLGEGSHFEVILPIELDKTADRSIRSRMEVIDTVSMIGPYMNEVLPPTPPKRKQQPIDIPDLYTFFFTQ